MSKIAHAAERRPVPADQIAVLGTWTEPAGSAEHGERTVRVFCWPEVAGAWARLAEAVAAAGQRARDQRKGVAATWMAASAPQICGPLQGDAALAEATLAALVQRLPVRITLALADDRPEGSAAVGRQCRALFSECMAPYATYLFQTNQVARAMALAGPSDDVTRWAEDAAFGSIQTLLDEGKRLKPMRLRHWTETALPLPLELAQVVAQGVSRHLDVPDRLSPLMDAIRSKAVGRVSWLGPVSKRRK